VSNETNGRKPQTDWRAIVERIRANDPAGQEALYRNLSAGTRLFFQRRLGVQDVEDRVHDLFITIVEAIQRGSLREPERLMGFVRTVLNRQLSLEISRIVRAREGSAGLDPADALTAADPTPEQQALFGEKLAIMKQLLRKMSDREFEVLNRFYLREQPPERIRKELGLSETQFHLLKSRAKARLTQLVRRKLSR
jgi:RNA polymerase sigma factor (sigma-70 family)